jgi:hypothetical protein
MFENARPTANCNSVPRRPYGCYLSYKLEPNVRVFFGDGARETRKPLEMFAIVAK